jgi:hypothetical protein
MPGEGFSMIGRPHLKISFSIALLFGLVANQPVLAKGAHAQHKVASAKGTNSVRTKPAETIDTSVTIQPPRRGFARDPRNSNASLKIVKPENLARRSNVTPAIKPPVVRNAIGQPVKSKSVMVDVIRLAPTAQAPGTVAKGAVGIPSPASPIRPSNVGGTSVHPTVTASNSSRGRIDAARLIRPSVAPLGIGGPARASNGINGTTVQPRRY